MCVVVFFSRFPTYCIMERRHPRLSITEEISKRGIFDNFRRERIFLPSSRRIIYPFLHSYLAIFTRVFVDKWVDEDKSMIERS